MDVASLPEFPRLTSLICSELSQERFDQIEPQLSKHVRSLHLMNMAVEINFVFPMLQVFHLTKHSWRPVEGKVIFNIDHPGVVQTCMDSLSLLEGTHHLQGICRLECEVSYVVQLEIYIVRNAKTILKTHCTKACPPP